MRFARERPRSLPKHAERQEAASQDRPNSKELLNGESRSSSPRGESLTQGGKRIDAGRERNSITHFNWEVEANWNCGSEPEVRRGLDTGSIFRKNFIRQLIPIRGLRGVV